MPAIDLPWYTCNFFAIKQQIEISTVAFDDNVKYCLSVLQTLETAIG